MDEQPENPLTENPLTELAASAALHHEVYLAYLDAGFSAAQALDLLKTIVTAGIQGAA